MFKKFKSFNYSQKIILVVAFLLSSYFLTGVLCFVFNNAIRQIFSHYSLKFTAVALVKGFPYIYQSLALSLVISFVLVAFLALAPSPRSLHGAARFANAREVKSQGLFADDGIIIGKYKGKLLRFGGQQFVALGAPTRSGKGVGIVIPNLLEWKQSAVVQDIKQECFDITSKYRAEALGQEVYLFNPFSRKTHRYNPLYYINMDGDNADGELTDFANILYPTVGSDTTQFFNQLAQNLFIGLCYAAHDLLNNKTALAIMHINKIDLSFTLYGILQLSEGFNATIDIGDDMPVELKGFESSYEFWCSNNLIGEKAKMRLQSYFAIDSDNTRSGVMSSFNAPLMDFRADNMRLATSATDFDFRDLRKKKMTIYIGITPDQLANAKRILNIFWQQLLLLNTKELPQANPALKYQVLLVMDEFTAPGCLPTYLKGISFIAGYNLRSLMIYQSNSQLEMPMPDGYGREGAKTLLTNHACQIYYTPREQEDAEKISKMLGNMTVSSKTRNYNGALQLNSTGSMSQTQRALMLPQELREMPFDEELITLDNNKPILANKSFYYNDDYFMDRIKNTAKSLKNLSSTPNKKQQDKAVADGELRIEIPVQDLLASREEILKQIEQKLQNQKGNE